MTSFFQSRQCPFVILQGAVSLLRLGLSWLDMTPYIVTSSECTGWHIRLIQTSRWHQIKSSALTCPSQARPGQNGTFDLMSTGGLNQPDVSPCTRSWDLHTKGAFSDLVQWNRCIFLVSADIWPIQVWRRLHSFSQNLIWELNWVHLVNHHGCQKA